MAFQSTLYLQANYLYEPDNLFTNNQSCLIPAFTVNRSGNLTESSAHKLLNPLKTALVAKIVIRWIGVAVAVLGAFLSGFVLFKLNVLKKKREKKSKSLLTESNVSDYLKETLT